MTMLYGFGVMGRSHAHAALRVRCAGKNTCVSTSAAQQRAARVTGPLGSLPVVSPDAISS